MTRPSALIILFDPSDRIQPGLRYTVSKTPYITGAAVPSDQVPTGITNTSMG